MGGCAYLICSKIRLKYHVDDPLDVFAVHYGAGLTGVLCVGIFDKTTGLLYGNGLK